MEKVQTRVEVEPCIDASSMSKQKNGKETGVVYEVLHIPILDSHDDEEKENTEVTDTLIEETEVAEIGEIELVEGQVVEIGGVLKQGDLKLTVEGPNGAVKSNPSRGLIKYSLGPSMDG